MGQRYQVVTITALYCPCHISVKSPTEKYCLIFGQNCFFVITFLFCTLLSFVLRKMWCWKKPRIFHIWQSKCLLLRGNGKDPPQTAAKIVASVGNLKGQCHEIFCFWFFSWISFPSAPDRFEFFQKFVEIFASQGAPPVSTTSVLICLMGYSGAGGKVTHEKNQKQKDLVTLSL